MSDRPPVTVGVEEEYLLVDPGTGELVTAIGDVYPVAEARTSGGEVAHELKRTMIEIGTPVCSSLAEVRAELTRLRAEVVTAAAERGYGVIAAATHPMVATVADDLTDEPDYHHIADRYAHLAHEQNVCGCHVHVGVADRELAIQALNTVRPWLPVLLALSASSPFWGGVDTGYASYRTEIFSRWPTSGPPEHLRDRAEFDEVVAQLLATETIDSPARLYWDARPSARYDTVEVRVADVCTDVDDAVLLAGLAMALVRHGVETAGGASPPAVRPEVLRGARWRAARYGLSGELVDVHERRTRPAHEVVARLLDVVTPQLRSRGELDTVTSALEHLLARGTSADRQRAHHAATGSGREVVEWLRRETASG